MVSWSVKLNGHVIQGLSCIKNINFKYSNIGGKLRARVTFHSSHWFLSRKSLTKKCLDCHSLTLYHSALVILRTCHSFLVQDSFLQNKTQSPLYCWLQPKCFLSLNITSCSHFKHKKEERHMSAHQYRLHYTAPLLCREPCLLWAGAGCLNWAAGPHTLMLLSSEAETRT